MQARLGAREPRENPLLWRWRVVGLIVGVWVFASSRELRGRIKRDFFPRKSSLKGIPVSVAETMLSHHPFLSQRSRLPEVIANSRHPLWSLLEWGICILRESGGDSFHLLHLYTNCPSPSLPQEVAGKWQLCVRCCVSCFEMSILI